MFMSFSRLPPSSIVLDDYASFLYHIGEQSLPDAFVRIANSLQRGDAQAMLVKSNTVFLPEVLRQRHVYGRPLELTNEGRLRNARRVGIKRLLSKIDQGRNEDLAVHFRK